MLWRGCEENLIKEICESKSYLQNLLEYRIDCFVAPNNIISNTCLNAVIKNDLHFSGIIPASFERNVSIKSVYNYIKRFQVRWRIRFNIQEF